MTTYKLTGDNSVIRDGVECIPFDPIYAEYQAYLAWLAEGNTADPANPIPAPVISVTPWAIREALNQTGLRDAVEDAVLLADRRTQDAWHYAQNFVRTDPLVVTLGAALGKTEADLDDLFTLASTL